MRQGVDCLKRRADNNLAFFLKFITLLEPWRLFCQVAINIAEGLHGNSGTTFQFEVVHLGLIRLSDLDKVNRRRGRCRDISDNTAAVFLT